MTEGPTSSRGHRPGVPVRTPSVDWEPGWIRPAVIFMLGLLLGTFIVAGTRPMPGVGDVLQGEDTSGLVAGCRQVIDDARHIAELADRTSGAVQRQDAAALASLGNDMSAARAALDRDLASCPG